MIVITVIVVIAYYPISAPALLRAVAASQALPFVPPG